jgi:hypothetical protein
LIKNLAQCEMTTKRVHARLLGMAVQYKIAGNLPVTADDDLRIRTGRIRDRGSNNSKPFVPRVLASAEKAGGIYIGRRSRTRSSFRRGRAAAFGASQMLSSRARTVVSRHAL